MPKKKKVTPVPMEDGGSIASSTEATGITPTPPADPEQLQSYSSLYGAPLGKDADPKKK